MARCGFKTDIKYLDEKTGEYIPYICLEPEQNILDSGLCIFHDENYLKDSKNRKANEQKLKRKLYEKLAESEPLICIGYHLTDFTFEGLHFDKSVNFSRSSILWVGLISLKSQFTKEADFYSDSSIYRKELY